MQLGSRESNALVSACCTTSKPMEYRIAFLSRFTSRSRTGGDE